MSRTVRVVRKKPTVVDRGPRDPTKQRVVVLRRVREGEDYVHKEEIPVSIGIPEYFTELKQIELAKRLEAEKFASKLLIYLMAGIGVNQAAIATRVSEVLECGCINGAELYPPDTDSRSESPELTIPLLKREIDRQDKLLYLIYGFPQKPPVGVEFEETVCHASAAIFLDVPEENLVAKLVADAGDAGGDENTTEAITQRVKASLEAAEAIYQIWAPRGKGLRIDARPPERVVIEGETPVEENPIDGVCGELERIARRVLNGEPLVPPPVEEEEEALEIPPE
jgi:hypothetical protein